jgi:hypothetical protein
MFFKRKESFFLDLGNEADKSKAAGQPAAVQVAVRQPEPEPAAPAEAPARAATEAQPAAAEVKAPATASAPAPAATSKPMLTTAEAIAAELRAAQESRPEPSNATFAPDCLNPANAIPSRRRTAGANLAGFKAMAADMFKS